MKCLELGKRSVLRDKRGSLLDIIFVFSILVAVGVGTLITYTIASSFNDQIQGMDLVTDNAKTSSTQLVGYYPGILDNMYGFLAFGLVIVSLILASLVRIHPIFIPFYFVGLLFVIFFSGVGSNVYQMMAENAAVSAQANNLLFIGTILNFLPLFTGVFGIILMVVMYKAWGTGQ